jgi:ATP-dependent protease ClpP protease subunit
MHDMRSAMQENINCEYRSFQILKEATGYTMAKIKAKFDSPSDQYFTAKELVALNVADHIL